MRITTLANQKGGVGKTTTAHNLGIYLRAVGNRVLLIDVDPQCNLTKSMGADDQLAGVYDLFKGDQEVHEIIQRTSQGDIISSSLILASADQEFTQTGREYMLRDSLEKVADEYDYVIIDTPPTLGILTINALTASNDIVVPMSADAFAIQGLTHLNEVVKRVRKYCANPSLRIDGLLMTKYNPKLILNRSVIEQLEKGKAQEMGTRVYQAFIREGVAQREAQIEQTNVFLYDPNSNPARDYESFGKEYIHG